jgi:hypothetical protein
MTTQDTGSKPLSGDLALVNGQVWMREYIPDLGRRWVRLVRAPQSPRNLVTTERLLSLGQVTELHPAE